MMKYIPNLITTSRIILIILAFIYFENPTISLSLYTSAVISDGLDGYIARKLKVQSELGAKLDSIADICVIIYILTYIVINTHLELYVYIIVAVIALIKLISLSIYFKTFHKFIMIHTYANKLTGLLMYLIPLFINNCIYLTTLLTIASYTCIEELIMAITIDKIDLNRRGFWDK